MQDSLPTSHRTWQVLLIGDASGSGKTSISYHLAHHFGVGGIVLPARPRATGLERAIESLGEP